MTMWRRGTGLVGLGLLLLALGPASSGADDTGLRYKRTVHRFDVPSVTLLNQDRMQVKLDDFVKSDRPVLVDFIFGTCTTICPVLSAGYSNLQRKLGEESEQVRLVSISIDPEHDTPEVMKKYLQRYRARPGWDFLTGSRTDIDQVMRAFDAYVPDKMSHRPIMFLRGPEDDEWIRIYGLVSTRELMEEYRKLLED